MRGGQGGEVESPIQSLEFSPKLSTLDPRNTPLGRDMVSTQVIKLLRAVEGLKNCLQNIVPRPYARNQFTSEQNERVFL